MAPARIETTDEYFRNDIPSKVPVLIIGGGPVGLLQAYCLGRHGIETVVCERYSKRLAAPKAHALSPRTLEVCRQYGLDTAEIRRLGTPRKEAFWVNFVTNLSSEQSGRLPYERMDADVLDDTPEMIHNIPQPAFEELLTQKLAEMPHVSIYKNISFVSLEQDQGTVSTTVEHRITGHQFQIESRYVLACDGMRSKVRPFLGIQNIGEDSYDTMMTIHFNADIRPVVKDRIGMLHWIMDPEVSGFIIAYDLAGNLVLICNFDAEKHSTASWDEKLCRQKIDSALGMKVKYDVLSWRPWILSRQVAESYQDGNIFLVGDAAHAFPPTGGLGLNSGLADAHNIAYKLAATLQGWANDSLLKSYQHERQHVAFVNSEQSVKNGRKIFSFLRALGTTEADVTLARQNLYQSIHDPQKKAEIDAHIEGQREHFDNLNLHVGYVYGDKTYPSDASKFQVSIRPGARLPHTWIRFAKNATEPTPISLPPLDVSYIDDFTTQDVDARQYSSLDLCRPEAFTVLAHVDSKIVLSGALMRVQQELRDRKVGLKIYLLGRDFDVEPSIQSGRTWVDLLGLEMGKVIVVRPDQHILGAWEEQDVKHTEDSLRNGVLEHLGL